MEVRRWWCVSHAKVYERGATYSMQSMQTKGWILRNAGSSLEASGVYVRNVNVGAVSYTHLTLPTKRIV